MKSEIDESFILTEDQLKEIFILVGDRFSTSQIVLTHACTLAIPSMMKKGLIPSLGSGPFFSPDFKINNLQIATAIRIFGLSKYGMLFHRMLDLSWDDLSLLIFTFKALNEIHEDEIAAYWIAKFIEIKDCRGECPLTQSGNLFFDDVFMEISCCDLLADLCFGEVEITENYQKVIDEFSEMLEGFYSALEVGKGSITEDE